MTCNDCIHFDLCIPVYSKIFGKGNGLDAEAETDGCGYFKDRSRFVELPCKLGDEIFCTTMGKIHQAVVDRIELYDEGVAIITTDGYCPDSSICYHTQEEAEQALKARSEQP